MGNNYYDTMNKPRRERVLVDGKLPGEEIIQVKKPKPVNVANNGVINETIEKLYWNMNQVCKQLKVPSSKLRYWEDYFNYSLKRGQGNKKIRVFTQEDIDFFIAVYNLIEVEGYTLKGTKKQLQKLKLLPDDNYNKRKKSD